VLDDVQRRSNQPLELEVEAFRWGWRFAYPAEGVVLEGVLDPGPQAVVPVGRPVQVTLTSNDVIHSFYVPKFLYKRDAIPGRTQVFELTVEREGLYTGQCAEFCGLFHARMPFSIRAVSEADFEDWLAEQRAGQAGSRADGAPSADFDR
jgi:cytochrome c oxidase subunit 2